MLSPKGLCQIEFHSDRIQDTLQFFAQVFGWTVLPITMHEQWVLNVPRDCPFGISVVADKSGSSRPSTVIYFRLHEAFEELQDKIVACGGHLLHKRKVPAYGTVHLIEVPGGIRLGLFTDSGDDKLIQIES